MSALLDYQLQLILSCFLAGTIGALYLYRRGASRRSWKVADLFWVVFGGLGAVAALLSGIYQSDLTRIGRQIDLAYAATGAFDRDAGRFRLIYCERDSQGPYFRPHVLKLCEKVEFLSASAATNATLPLFIEVAEATAPLGALRGLLAPFGRGDEPSMDRRKMTAMAAGFDPATFLAFAAEDDRTRAATAALETDIGMAAIAAEFRVIAASYDRLIAAVARLKDEWDFLQTHAQVLILQVIALCLIALAAPFRLGKAIVELRQS
jgi:hypothetical protein